MQDVKSVDRYEAMPELSVILEKNFLQDEKGRWYILNVTKEGNVARLHEKKLWKEFEGYLKASSSLSAPRLFASVSVACGRIRTIKPS